MAVGFKEAIVGERETIEYSYRKERSGQLRRTVAECPKNVGEYFGLNVGAGCPVNCLTENGTVATALEVG